MRSAPHRTNSINNAGVESGANEVLADEMTRRVKEELSKPIADQKHTSHTHLKIGVGHDTAQWWSPTKTAMDTGGTRGHTHDQRSRGDRSRPLPWFRYQCVAASFAI